MIEPPTVTNCVKSLDLTPKSAVRWIALILTGLSGLLELGVLTIAALTGSFFRMVAIAVGLCLAATRISGL
ncbi:MAG: hypothetical protein ACP5JG_03200 [Anaerolineae bacterium]